TKYADDALSQGCGGSVGGPTSTVHESHRPRPTKGSRPKTQRTVPRQYRMYAAKSNPDGVSSWRWIYFALPTFPLMSSMLVGDCRMRATRVGSWAARCATSFGGAPPPTSTSRPTLHPNRSRRSSDLGVPFRRV